MAEVSAGLVNTGSEGQRLGDNTGGAVVLDRTPETAIPNVQELAKELTKYDLVQKSQQRLRDEQQRRADEKLFLDLNNDLKIEYARGAYGDKAVERLNTQSNELAKMKASGASIGEIAKKQAEMQRENDVIGRDAQNVFRSFDSWVGLEKPIMENPLKYDSKYYDAQMRKINSMLQEGKDLREVDKYMSDPKNYPLRRDVDTKTIMADATPNFTVTDRLKYINPETVRNNLTLRFGGTDDGMEEMDTLISQGSWGNNFDEVINKMTETIVANNPSEPIKQSKTGGGKTPTGYNLTLGFEESPHLDISGGNNTLVVTSSTGGEMKPIQVTGKSEKGDTTSMLFQPGKFQKLASGKIIVEGFEVAEEVEGQTTMSVTTDGQTTEVSQPKKVTRLRPVAIEYSENKTKLDGSVGKDISDLFSTKKASKSGSEKPNNSTGTVNKFVGVPQGGFNGGK